MGRSNSCEVAASFYTSLRNRFTSTEILDHSITDRARFSFAHGGKDGYPYPVDKKTYDTSIQTLHTAVEKAMLGRREQVGALKRLAQWSDTGRSSDT